MAYKLKSNRGAAKRFKVTGSGKVKFTKANRRHLLTGKAQKSKRQARAGGYLNLTDSKTVKELLALKS